MTKVPLPIIDHGRREFNSPRTICSCDPCTHYCLHLPGYLLPSDLTRIKQHLAPDLDLFAWAREHLLASPGAVVMQRGCLFRIPTLVPARREDGACHFLTSDRKCSIHAVAPFGCAFFDSHQKRQESDRLSSLGLHVILEAWRTGDTYAQIWIELDKAGLRAPAPEACRNQSKEGET